MRKPSCNCFLLVTLLMMLLHYWFFRCDTKFFFFCCFSSAVHVHLIVYYYCMHSKFILFFFFVLFHSFSIIRNFCNIVMLWTNLSFSFDSIFVCLYLCAWPILFCALSQNSKDELLQGHLPIITAHCVRLYEPIFFLCYFFMVPFFVKCYGRSHNLFCGSDWCNKCIIWFISLCIWTMHHIGYTFSFLSSF